MFSGIMVSHRLTMNWYTYQIQMSAVKSLEESLYNMGDISPNILYNMCMFTVNLKQTKDEESSVGEICYQNIRYSR